MKETYKILIISEVQGYINHVSQGQDKRGRAIKVSVVEPDVAQISAERDTIGAYLIYGPDGIGDMQQALIYLKDQSAERDIPTFTVGSREENDAIGRVISGHLIRQFFERPVNVNELVEVIDTYIAKFGAQHKKKVLVVDDSGGNAAQCQRLAGRPLSGHLSKFRCHGDQVFSDQPPGSGTVRL